MTIRRRIRRSPIASKKLQDMFRRFRASWRALAGRMCRALFVVFDVLPPSVVFT
jgi:hypothetical protein